MLLLDYPHTDKQSRCTNAQCTALHAPWK